ncbi:OmpA family protein [Lysobacter firmicutimachus]|uniref:OmpA family protein n=1 Tax=Lysobacter firmicutimachus TaxID=1792846 RepID=A0ABU8D4D4_9GAMM
MRIDLLNSLVGDVAHRFGLSMDQARQLAGVLIALIFDEKRGGFAGFVHLFESKGLGSLVQSWIGTGPNQPISAPQVERAFGAPLIGAIAGKLDAPVPATAGAIGALLPGLINELTEGGKAPTGIPETLRYWVASIADWLGDLGRFGWGALAAGAAAVGGAVAGGVRAVGHAADTTVDAAAGVARKTGRGLAAFLPWLILLLALLAALAWFKGCQRQREAAADASVSTSAPLGAEPAATAPVAQSNARFSFENAEGKARIGGQVASEAEKTKLLDAIKATFGAGNVEGDLVVDAGTAPAGWLDRLIALLPDLKARGVKLGFDGDKIDIDTSALPEAERFALSQKLRSGFGGFEISGLWDQAMAALSSLKAGFSADDLVKALNLSAIYFDTGSASITRDSYETLRKAAEAIKAAPAGTRIEVGGHTDATGDAAANLQLSLERANAVTAKLVELGVPGEQLVGKGYGQDKPIADNASEEGKARNRRMEFTVLR